MDDNTNLIAEEVTSTPASSPQKEQQVSPPAAAPAAAPPDDLEWTPSDRPVKNVVAEAARKTMEMLRPYLDKLSPEKQSEVFKQTLDGYIKSHQREQAYQDDGRIIFDDKGNAVAIKPHQAGVDRVASLEEKFDKFIEDGNQRRQQEQFEIARNQQIQETRKTYLAEMKRVGLRDTKLARSSVEYFMIQEDLDIPTAIQKFKQELAVYNAGAQTAPKNDETMKGPAATPRGGPGEPRSGNLNFDKAKTAEEVMAMFNSSLGGG